MLELSNFAEFTQVLRTAVHQIATVNQHIMIMLDHFDLGESVNTLATWLQGPDARVLFSDEELVEMYGPMVECEQNLAIQIQQGGMRLPG